MTTKSKRDLGVHSGRQQVVAGFIVDFYCHKAGLVVEVDGEIHDLQQEEDGRLEKALRGLGLATFCFSLLTSNTLPHSLILFGLVVGSLMTFGLLGIPGILARVDTWSPDRGISVLPIWDFSGRISCIPSGRSGWTNPFDKIDLYAKFGFEAVNILVLNARDDRLFSLSLRAIWRECRWAPLWGSPIPFVSLRGRFAGKGYGVGYYSGLTCE